MAIDMSGESSSSSTITSPRISFSHDLHQSDGPDESLQDSELYRDFDDDFDFCIDTSSADASSSTAEDLFLDGKIRSLQLQDKFVIPFPPPPPPPTAAPVLPIPVSPNGISNQESAQKKLDLDVIKRSSSLHCDHKKSSFWSSLQLLSRSNSTGSVPKVVKENPKSKQVKNSSSAESSSSSSSNRKPPLRKNYVGYYNKGNGMRVNPVLNMSPPNISKKTANLLGLGTFFGSDNNTTTNTNKDKKIKK